jgi:hypothetical protein
MLDGRIIDTAAISFDPVTYHFTMGAEDVTNNIRRADKQDNWPEFDPETDNRRASNESRGGFGPVGELEESTLVILGEQLAKDPLAAPLASLNTALNQVLGSHGFLKLAALTVAVLVVVVIVRKKG